MKDSERRTGWGPSRPVVTKDGVRDNMVIVERLIRGNLQAGRSPHVVINGIRYRNVLLSQHPEWIGRRAIIAIGPNSSCFVAQLGNGRFLGELEAAVPKSACPESRREQLICRKRLGPTSIGALLLSIGGKIRRP